MIIIIDRHSSQHMPFIHLFKKNTFKIVYLFNNTFFLINSIKKYKQRRTNNIFYVGKEISFPVDFLCMMYLIIVDIHACIRLSTQMLDANLLVSRAIKSDNLKTNFILVCIKRNKKLVLFDLITENKKLLYTNVNF